MRPLAVVGLVLVAASLVSGLIVGLYFQLGHVHDDHRSIETADSGAFFSFEFQVFGSGTEISYDFVVEAGPDVDVYLLTPADFARYQVGLRPQEAGFIHEGVREVHGSPYPEEGRYVAVVDNSDYGIARSGGVPAVVRYDLRAGGFPGRDQFADMGVLIASALLLGAVFMVGVALFATYREPRRPLLACPSCRRPNRSWPCRSCGAVPKARRVPKPGP